MSGVPRFCQTWKYPNYNVQFEALLTLNCYYYILYMPLKVHIISFVYQKRSSYPEFSNILSATNLYKFEIT